MTDRITLPTGEVYVVIEATSPQECSFCHRVEECRPYSKSGLPICFACAMTPERKATTLRLVKEMMR